MHYQFLLCVCVLTSNALCLLHLVTYFSLLALLLLGTFIRSAHLKKLPKLKVIALHSWGKIKLFNAPSLMKFVSFINNRL